MQVANKLLDEIIDSPSHAAKFVFQGIQVELLLFSSNTAETFEA